MCTDNIKIENLEDKIFIVTENTDGEIYTIAVENIKDLLDDWKGECNFVPCNDAHVFFASYYGNYINMFMYNDFESLLRYMLRFLNI